MISNDRTPGAHRTVEALLGHYLNFLKNSQGLADATLVLRRFHVEPFLRTLQNGGALADLHGLAPSTVHDYIIATSKPLTRASRKHLVSALRSFLRFAHVKGLLARNLVDAVPVFLTRKLDQLPHTISWEDVQKLLAAPDRTTLIGKRDYAILRLVASYGLRIGQAIHLHCTPSRPESGSDHDGDVANMPAQTCAPAGDGLRDYAMFSFLYNTGARVQEAVDAKVEAVRFSSPPIVTITGKGSKTRIVPLWQSTATILLEHVRERGVDKQPDSRLSVNARDEPLTRFGVRHILRKRLDAAKPACGSITGKRVSPHTVRHSTAMHLLQSGVDLTVIQRWLGHVVG